MPDNTVFFAAADDAVVVNKHQDDFQSFVVLKTVRDSTPYALFMICA
jgi:hypothetical protein